MGAKLGVRHQLWPPSMAPVHGHSAFHSWPWRIPFMAMAPFHSWPWPCRCRNPTTVTVAPPNHWCMPWRMACASPPRGFRLNRSIPGIKTCWRWGWFRGVPTVDKGDHRTSRFFKILGPKSRDILRLGPLKLRA